MLAKWTARGWHLPFSGSIALIPSALLFSLAGVQLSVLSGPGMRVHPRRTAGLVATAKEVLSSLAPSQEKDSKMILH